MRGSGTRRRDAVPGYVLTSGRSDTPSELGWGLETLLKPTCSPHPLPPDAGSRGHRQLLRECGAGVTSVVEAAAQLGRPVSVARVLAGDLVASGHLTVPAPRRPEQNHEPSIELLQEVLDGLRNKEFA
ncbi:DUF742 domain-containing protein [Streptomyces sp. NPDC054796]|uniref:DUF742 domain-containing protein n=1 Tax=Streptomyces daliensis TaxID=299421 RepID=A0A8T4IR59_9ACTN|nr:DUF742 domain-containing protein [Streptomyces daliensis]